MSKHYICRVLSTQRDMQGSHLDTDGYRNKKNTEIELLHTFHTWV